MASIKYYYNPETCKYEPIVLSAKQKIFRGALFVATSLVTGFFALWLYSFVFESPTEALLRKENASLKFYYKLLNKELDKSQEVLISLQQRDDNIYRSIFETSPISVEARTAGTGGTAKYKEILDKGLLSEDIIITALTKADALKKQVYVQSKSYDEVTKLARNKEKMLQSIPAIQPISNKRLLAPVSGYGMRIHPIYKVKKFHTGLDFAATKGTPVYATGNGVVITANKSFSGYGNEIEIKHGFGYITKYAHLNGFKIKAGQKVKRGQLIGWVGTTGTSVSPHLHYEVIKAGNKVNPIHYFYNDLKPAEYQKLLEMASEENQSLGGE